MPNILSLLHPDGTSALSTEIRNGVPQPVLDFEMNYSDAGGEGISEFLVRNITSDNEALNVVVSAPTLPRNPQTNQALDQQWDFKNIGSDLWNNRWLNSITIDRIPPGQFVHVRSRVIAQNDSEPTTHSGGLMIKYKRSSV